MLTKLNYQNVVIENQNPGHRKSRQNKKKGGRYRIQRKIQNGYLNSQKYHKKMYIYNTTFNLVKLNFSF